MAHDRGTVTGRAHPEEATLVVIDWDGTDLPEKVHVANLSQLIERCVLDRN